MLGMLYTVQSKDVNWWGYVEGEPLVLSIVTLVFVAFVGVYLFRRLRRPVQMVVVPARSRRL